MGDTLRKLGWSALTLVMFLAFLEILCRRVGVPEERHHIQMDFDGDLMWGLENEPGKGPEYRVNSLGLRGDELSAGGTVRLLTLGDSSIYGHGVAIDEVFGAVLAARLDAARPTPRVEAVDGGVPGYSTFQSLRLLERLAPVVHPDVVLVGNMWSDAYRSAVTDRAWAAELTAVYGPWQPVTSSLAMLSRHSALARRLRRSIHDGLSPAKGKANEIGWSHLVEPEPGSPPGKGGGRPPKGGEETLPTSRVPLDEYEANLHALAAAARACGAVPAYLLLPHPNDEQPGRGGAEPAYRDALRAVAAAEHAPLVDAPKWFAEHPADEPRFSDDIHPNARGHADLASAVLAVFAADPAVAARLGIAP
jgi:lysophospholipase L1-like esterase